MSEEQEEIHNLREEIESLRDDIQELESRKNKMIKYREHRGSLEESLKTYQEFESIGKLFKFIADNAFFPTSVRKIKIMYYGFDERINQELFMVRSDDAGVFGFIYEEVTDGN